MPETDFVKEMREGKLLIGSSAGPVMLYGGMYRVQMPNGMDIFILADGAAEAVKAYTAVCCQHVPNEVGGPLTVTYMGDGVCFPHETLFCDVDGLKAK